MLLSYIELNKRNLIHNVKTLRAVAKKGTSFAFAIKGNAYGHGQNEIAKIIEPYSDYFIVNSVEELALLRKVSKKKTLVLGYVAPSDLPYAISLESVLAVFSLTTLRNINRCALQKNKIQEVHIACDALLGREGFLISDLPEVFKEALKLTHIRITGMYAHFANIEDTSNFSHARKQIKEYESMLAIARNFGYIKLLTHISATSSLLVYEKKLGIHPLVRIGIGMYGLWPSATLEKKYFKEGITLKPVLSWKTHIALVKVVPKGYVIGYGCTYVTKKITKIALIPQGYADGIDRGLSNIGEVLINGVRCRLLGRISMNMCVADVTELSKAKEGDEVVILGEQNKEEIRAEAIAQKIGTINYEIVTRISSLLPRVIR